MDLATIGAILGIVKGLWEVGSAVYNVYQGYQEEQQEKEALQQIKEYKKQQIQADIDYLKNVEAWKIYSLDLQLTQEELLKQMHQKTRYNLKLAQQKVTARISREPADLEKFWRLIQDTGRRQGFRHFPKNYYEQLLESNLAAKLYLAEYQDKVIAANLVLFFGDTAAYLHGASDYHARQLMAPYLLQWRAIIDAQQAGCRYYDFWGVAPAEAFGQHPWSGISRFKLGFVNQDKTKITNLVGTWDLPYKIFWYKLYQLGRRLKR